MKQACANGQTQTQMTRNRIISLYGKQKEGKRLSCVQKKKKQWDTEELERGRSEGKIMGISVQALGGESLKGFEAAQISNTALAASRAWNLSLFGVALAANSPSPCKNTSLTFHHFSEGNQFSLPELTCQQFLFIPKLLALYKHTATPTTVEVFSCYPNPLKTVPFSIFSKKTNISNCIIFKSAEVIIIYHRSIC